MCSWIRRLNSAKMSIYPKEICRLNAIPIKISMVFFKQKNDPKIQSCQLYLKWLVFNQKNMRHAKTQKSA